MVSSSHCSTSHFCFRPDCPSLSLFFFFTPLSVPILSLRNCLFFTVLLALFPFSASHLLFIFLSLSPSPPSHPYFVWCQANHSATVSRCIAASPLLLSIPIWCESDYGGWCISWCMVCVCVGGMMMLTDRWKVREATPPQMEVSVCHLLSAVFSTRRVTPL